jgi:hypothetical protein
MREGIDFKCYPYFSLYFSFFLPRSFVILIVTLSCRIKVILRNGRRKKEIRSVIPKVSYNSESLKLSYVQLDVLKYNVEK